MASGYNQEATANNLTVANFSSIAVERDVTLASDSDDKIPTVKSAKAYIDNKISSSGTIVSSSSTNGNIKINNTETVVYTLPIATSSTLGGVKSSSTVNVSIDGNGVLSVNTDNKSLNNNSTYKLQLNGFEVAPNNTLLIKNSSGTLGYISIAPNSGNSYTKVASIEYVNEVISGEIALQGNYNASTNTPDITAISTNEKSLAWIVNTAGNPSLGGSSIELAVNDWIIKTNSGAYAKIDNTNNTLVWGTISGTLTDQTDLKNELDKKIDKPTTFVIDEIGVFDTNRNVISSGKKISDITALIPTKTSQLTNDSNFTKINDSGVAENTTDTYSVDKIISLLANKQDKFIISSTMPTVGLIDGLLWIRTGVTPYEFYEYDLTSTSFKAIGSSLVIDDSDLTSTTKTLSSSKIESEIKKQAMINAIVFS